MIPVVQNFTLWFLIAIWGDVFFLSIITLNPLGLMIADACGPHELAGDLTLHVMSLQRAPNVLGSFLLMARKSLETPEIAETANGVRENQVFLFQHF